MPEVKKPSPVGVKPAERSKSSAEKLLDRFKTGHVQHKIKTVEKMQAKK